MLHKNISSVVVVLYGVAATLFVWSLDSICAAIVKNDSVWQALDAVEGSHVHLIAEAIHQIPMLGNIFGLVTLVLVARLVTEAEENA